MSEELKNKSYKERITESKIRDIWLRKTESMPCCASHSCNHKGSIYTRVLTMAKNYEELSDQKNGKKII